MDLDDLDPRAPRTAPRPLDTLSIAELDSYIPRLEAEIGRAQAAIAAKQGARGAAEAAFRR